MSEVLAWLKQKVDIIDKQTEHKDLEKVVRKYYCGCFVRLRIVKVVPPPRVHLLRDGYNCRISLKYSNPKLMAVCYLNFMLITRNLNLHVRLPNGGK